MANNPSNPNNPGGGQQGGQQDVNRGQQGGADPKNPSRQQSQDINKKQQKPMIDQDDGSEPNPLKPGEDNMTRK
jgi:hypothetical protein